MKIKRKTFNIIVTILGTLLVGELITFVLMHKKKGQNKGNISIPTPTNTYTTNYTPCPTE